MKGEGEKIEISMTEKHQLTVSCTPNTGIELTAQYGKSNFLVHGINPLCHASWAEKKRKKEKRRRVFWDLA